MIQRFSCYDCSNETQESCWQSEQFQFFAVIIIPMKYWNHFANNFFFSFCCCFVNSSELSQLLTALFSDEFTKQQQNDNKKMIPVFCWNDDYCKSLESFWLSALIPAFYLNDHNKKSLESLNLAGWALNYNTNNWKSILVIALKLRLVCKYQPTIKVTNL